MDYTELAREFLQNMHGLRSIAPQKRIMASLQGEIFALQYIAEHGDDVLPGEISNVMNISSARIAAALNSLESKGLITRRIDKSDRRQILISLTETGKELADKHKQEALQDAAKILSLLGEHEAREYVRITSKLVQLASKAAAHKE